MTSNMQTAALILEDLSDTEVTILTQNQKCCLISAHLHNLCGDILLPENTAQWHAEVTSAVKLHNQEVSFSVPRYRVLQVH